MPLPPAPQQEGRGTSAKGGGGGRGTQASVPIDPPPKLSASFTTKVGVRGAPRRSTVVVPSCNSGGNDGEEAGDNGPPRPRPPRIGDDCQVEVPSELPPESKPRQPSLWPAVDPLPWPEHGHSSSSSSGSRGSTTTSDGSSTTTSTTGTGAGAGAARAEGEAEDDDYVPGDEEDEEDEEDEVPHPGRLSKLDKREAVKASLVRGGGGPAAVRGRIVENASAGWSVEEKAAFHMVYRTLGKATVAYIKDLDNPNKSPSERALAAALDPHIAVLRAKSADEMHKYMYCGFRGSPDHLAAKCSARNMEARVFQPLHHLHDDVRAASAPLPIWSYHQTTCDKCQADVLDGVKSAYVQRCGGCPAVAHAVQKCAGQNAASAGLWFCRACRERHGAIMGQDGEEAARQALQQDVASVEAAVQAADKQAVLEAAAALTRERWERKGRPLA